MLDALARAMAESFSVSCRTPGRAGGWGGGVWLRPALLGGRRRRRVISSSAACTPGAGCLGAGLCFFAACFAAIPSAEHREERCRHLALALGRRVPCSWRIAVSQRVPGPQQPLACLWRPHRLVALAVIT
jgi:hypothetical protein